MLDARGTISQIVDILFDARNFPLQVGCNLELGTSCYWREEARIRIKP